MILDKEAVTKHSTTPYVGEMYFGEYIYGFQISQLAYDKGIIEKA